MYHKSLYTVQSLVSADVIQERVALSPAVTDTTAKV